MKRTVLILLFSIVLVVSVALLNFQLDVAQDQPKPGRYLNYGGDSLNDLKKVSNPICPDCNLILVSIDALSAKHMGLYNYYRNTTPHIDELAKSGIVFSKAYAPASWTLESHVSMFTGTYPSTHKVRAYNSTYTGEYGSLAKTLNNAGWRTAAFVGGGFMNPEYGFDLGFNSYYSTYTDYYSINLSTKEQSYSPEKNTFNNAKKWISANKDSKFFLFLHTYQVHDYANMDDDSFIDANSKKLYENEFKRDPDIIKFTVKYQHQNLTVEDKGRSAYLEERYDSALHDVDREVDDLVKYLEEEGILNNSIIIITSDHGEAFGEHALLAHTMTLYDEITNVPLIILPPQEEWINKSVETPVSLVDIRSTATHLLGYESSPLDGVDLIPLIQDDNHILSPKPENVDLRVIFGDAPFTKSTYLLKDSEKLIRYGPSTSGGERFEYFDLSKDAGEQHDIYHSVENCTDIRDETDLLREVAIETERPSITDNTFIVNNEIRMQLSALGYVN
jgi:arylsulfatase A-like enzyme